ncbi:MAG: DJ-1/PfpI family protein [Cellvibrio sp.]|uniref:DJ-1/PfpI family protein n=1 Tax=Cellvibrio sp. TaxID=1965322 RepID=UPI0031A85EFB
MSFNIGIFLFPEIEVLDFAGPYEVFTTATRVAAREGTLLPPIFNVYAIAESLEPVTARAGLKFIPDFQLNTHPGLDVLIIPGGVVNAEMQKPYVQDWISRTASSTAITASVCTGAFLLAKAGLLTTHKVTTHWEDQNDLKNMFPSLDVISDVRWVDEGSVVTSAGISAGIDMSLHLIERFAGLPLAERTAKQMEFEWTRNGISSLHN